jgi:hypothetical protein
MKATNTKSAKPDSAYTIELSKREFEFITAILGSLSSYKISAIVNDSWICRDGLIEDTNSTEVECYFNCNNFLNFRDLLKSDVFPVFIKTVEFVYDKNEYGVSPKWRKVKVITETFDYIEGMENGVFKRFLKSRILGGKVFTIDA